MRTKTRFISLLLALVMSFSLITTAFAADIPEDAITIKKAAAVPHKTLEERLTEFYGKPIQEIGPLQAEEVDWGKAEGREVW